MRQTQRQALLLSKSRIKYAHIQFHAMPSVRFWCLSPHLHHRKMSKISNRQGKSFNHPVTLIQSLYFRVATISLMSTLNSKHSGIQCPPITLCRHIFSCWYQNYYITEYITTPQPLSTLCRYIFTEYITTPHSSSS